ncbi:hypothetical protein [Asticcacaulis sp. 201]|uniref:hypothetical protein n=1 Tax=Asticcacaulis sp. 201 TaxID=3028787 RepID=UPI0029162814|nr:hypothetical protein [Asticcacaulis sp. 201]MDV6330069.1 hypothetical protein [Asticcacaulis sp. 201]
MSKAWFVKIGPFGGLLPCRWQGGLTLILGVSLIVSMAVFADKLSHTGHQVDGQRLDLACIITGILLYIFAAAKSKPMEK